MDEKSFKTHAGKTNIHNKQNKRVDFSRRPPHKPPIGSQGEDKGNKGGKEK